jgi:hypothetical protein
MDYKEFTAVNLCYVDGKPETCSIGSCMTSSADFLECLLFCIVFSSEFYMVDHGNYMNFERRFHEYKENNTCFDLCSRTLRVEEI